MPPMLRHRLTFGVLMVVALVGLLWGDQALGPVSVSGGLALPAGLPMLIAFMVLIWLGVGELDAMLKLRGLHPQRGLATLGAWAVCLAAYLKPAYPGVDHAAVLASLFAGLFLTAMVRHSVPLKRTEGAASAGGAVLLGVAYLGVLPGFYLELRAMGTAWLVAGVMLVTKACDIGAYFTGRSLGRRKLIAWLSPGKTVEGLVGGLLLSGVTAALLAAAGNRWGLAGDRTLPLAGAAAGGVLLGGLGHVGDLLESLLKRDAGVKDSGASVPGFGGVLDVVDSPLLVAPLAYWLLA